MVDRDLFWPVGLVLEQQGGEAGAGSGRLAATNSCRGASDNGSAAAASVALRMMWMRVASRAAACLLEWGAELGRQCHLAAGSSDLCSSRVHVQGDPGRSACPMCTPTETRAMQVSGNR